VLVIRIFHREKSQSLKVIPRRSPK
jgi:hypothetical protein